MKRNFPSRRSHCLSPLLPHICLSGPSTAPRLSQALGQGDESRTLHRTFGEPGSARLLYNKQSKPMRFPGALDALRGKWSSHGAGNAPVEFRHTGKQGLHGAACPWGHSQTWLTKLWRNKERSAYRAGLTSCGGTGDYQMRSTAQKYLEATAEPCSSSLPKSRGSGSTWTGHWTRSFPALGAATSPLCGLLMSITQGNGSGENTERRLKSTKPNRETTKYSVVHCLAYRWFEECC